MAEKHKEKKESIVIKFAGDSGDGMQLTGNQFTSNSALVGNDIATFPDFPAEIRAPQGTLAGVSGFQLHFGSKEVNTPGDHYDVLVAMNAAALRTNLGYLENGGILIVNTTGFDKKNLRLAGYEENPLENDSLADYRLIHIDVTKMTRECLKDYDLGTKEKDRCKNMFVLGFLLWMYNRSLDSTTKFLQNKFRNKQELAGANTAVLKAGYNFGDTTETFTTRYDVPSADLPPGKYRGVMGNQATALGMIAASRKSNLPLFLGSYPITPASDILHQLARYKNFGVRTFQAEDEISSITAAMGASFGGSLGVSTTSGPGMALKAEGIGLAVMMELPLLICNIQRAGPSTGMPTKTEQADLMQALHARNGESPLPVIAARSPSDCFEAVFEACRIAVLHMTPVIFLSDGYIATGSEPWRYPQSADLPEIDVTFSQEATNGEETPYQPYQRNEDLVRPWAIPGTKNLEHRLGGLEKQELTGNVSYDPENHERMVHMREEKIQRIADHLPRQQIIHGAEEGDVLFLGWGSTYGSIKSAVKELNNEGIAAGHVHLRHLKPLQKGLEDILNRFDQIIIPEMNNGQLVSIIRDKYLVDAHSYNKVQGVPITKKELKEKAREMTGKEDVAVSNKN